MAAALIKAPVQYMAQSMATYTMKPFQQAERTVTVGDLTLYGVPIFEGDDVVMLVERDATSLCPLKREDSVQARFPSPSNGELAGAKRARGDGDDEVSRVSNARIVKPSKPINLSRQRQIVTRLQSLQIASVFPFLDLPAELRLAVYDFALNFSGVEAWFDKFWKALLASKHPSKEKPPVVYRRTPPVLLICKQIYHEAMPLLKTQGISFHHGLLDIVGLDNIMNTNILKTLTSINIDASGHTVIPAQKGLVGPSWRGHLDLIVDLSILLAGKDHNLKKFTLNIVDKSIHNHVHDCWVKDKHIRCDYRDQLKEALDHLGKIRSVGKVNFAGIPEHLVAPLKARMESPPLSFLDLPGEIRNQIYELCGDWSDISKHLKSTLHAWIGDGEEKKHNTVQPYYPPRSTPTVLLLNKQIHAEAKSVLHAKPLVLDMPADARLAKTTETLNAMYLITAPTLANVAHVRINIESWEWVYALDRLWPHLVGGNKKKQHTGLKTFKLTFRDNLKRTFLAKGNRYPDNTLHQSLSALAGIRGVGAVEFVGDLPASYTAPLKMIMESVPADGEVLPKLRAVVERDVGVGKVVSVVDIDGKE